jgi:F-type H+-transporting ATPase subunit b
MSPRQKFFLALALALAISGPSALQLSTLQAQEGNAPKEQKTEQQGANPSSSKETKAETKENEGDENAELKHSPGVEFVARKTGLTLNQAYWALVFFNFAVVLVILWMLLRKILPAVFKSRTEAIQKRMEEARKASEEARQRLADVESRLSRLDSDIANMRREADETARAEEERIRNSAEEERKRIVHTAEQEIAMAANSARRELKSYVAELAVDLAEKKIKIEQSADQNLVREFASQIGKDGN